MNGASKNNKELKPQVIITITWSNFFKSWTTIAINVKGIANFNPSSSGTNDPKIFGALVAVFVGYFSKNIIATISAGLTSYWFLIFVVFN